MDELEPSRDLTDQELDDLLRVSAADPVDEVPSAEDVYAVVEMLGKRTRNSNARRRIVFWAGPIAAGFALVALTGWWLQGQFSQLRLQNQEVEASLAGRILETKRELKADIAATEMRQAEFERDVLQERLEVWRKLVGTEVQLAGTQKRLRGSAVKLVRSEERLKALVATEAEAAALRLEKEQEARLAIENRVADNVGKLNQQKTKLETITETDKKQTKILRRFELWGDQAGNGTASSDSPDAGRRPGNSSSL